MAFRKLPDNGGIIFIPDIRKEQGKRQCSDCYSCNWCSDDRCLLCRPDRPGSPPPTRIKK